MDGTGGNVDFIHVLLPHALQLLRKAGVGQLVRLTAVAVKISRKLYGLTLVLRKTLLPVIEGPEAGRAGANGAGFFAMQNRDFLNRLFHDYSSNVMFPCSTSYTRSQTRSHRLRLWVINK